MTALTGIANAIVVVFVSSMKSKGRSTPIAITLPPLSHENEKPKSRTDKGATQGEEAWENPPARI
ncbi:hypothetical protein BJY01DRAFT_255732 [Aspergillus pseudoustus]|uniref:Uncharacterized protein n=1 Tax=Aspergillus pseudoustus TaxID=1810923 RepID=A0ABR4IK81_9EURO